MLRLTTMMPARISFHLPILTGLLFGFACSRGIAAAQHGDKAGDDIFSHTVVPRLEFQIPPEAMKVLREYHQVWRQPRPERIDVKVTVREGANTYTNVAVHLKGSFSYQDIDQKPSLTLNFS